LPAQPWQRRLTIVITIITSATTTDRIIPDRAGV
jgi:hypothetical protein